MSLAIKSISGAQNNINQQYSYKNDKTYKNNVAFKGSIVYSELEGFARDLEFRLNNINHLKSIYLMKFEKINRKIAEKMKKFSDSTSLMFKKKTEKEYEVYIQNPNSHYVKLLPNLKLPETDNLDDDLVVLEKFSENLENINQFDTELKFCQMRLNSADRDKFTPSL